MTDTKSLGNLGEKIAKEYLIKNGYIFLRQNYTANRRELDLIFRLQEKTIFVEVKTRIKNSESVLENPLTHLQTKNLKQAMLSYCFKNRISLKNVRLDLIIILADKKTRQADLKHYPDIL